MKLMPLDYIYQTLQNDIEEGVQLEEGVTPTVAELLEFHLKENDENFLNFIFRNSIDDEYRDISSLSELTEDEMEQVEKLRRYCAE